MWVKQVVGNALLTAAIPVSIAIAGWLHSDISSLLAAINGHSQSLSGITQKIDDLTTAVRDHNHDTDAALNKLLDDDQKHTAAIATAEAELEDLRREAPRIERDFVPAAPRSPDPLPTIGNAIQHLFRSLPGAQPHRWRGRRQ